MAQAYTPFSEMPRAIALNGSELVCLSLYRPDMVPLWLTEVIPISDLGFFIANNLGTSMRQIKAALADQGNLYALFMGISSDPTDSFNIAWTTASRMTPTDPFITGCLQPVLGYSDADVVVLFALAATFPY